MGAARSGFKGGEAADRDRSGGRRHAAALRGVGGRGRAVKAAAGGEWAAGGEKCRVRGR